MTGILEAGDCARCGVEVHRFTARGAVCTGGWVDENGCTSCGWHDHIPVYSTMRATV